MTAAGLTKKKRFAAWRARGKGEGSWKNDIRSTTTASGVC